MEVGLGPDTCIVGQMNHCCQERQKQQLSEIHSERVVVGLTSLDGLRAALYVQIKNAAMKLLQMVEHGCATLLCD